MKTDLNAYLLTHEESYKIRKYSKRYICFLKNLSNLCICGEEKLSKICMHLESFLYCSKNISHIRGVLGIIHSIIRKFKNAKVSTLLIWRHFNERLHEATFNESSHVDYDQNISHQDKKITNKIPNMPNEIDEQASSIRFRHSISSSSHIHEAANFSDFTALRHQPTIDSNCNENEFNANSRENENFLPNPESSSPPKRPNFDRENLGTENSNNDHRKILHNSSSSPYFDSQTKSFKSWWRAPNIFNSHEHSMSPRSRISSQGGITFQARVFAFIFLVFSLAAQYTECCSSRSTPRPRFTTAPTHRPNITFQTYSCPPRYAAWYCLNGASCFTVRIETAILYNCECSEGFMGPRCEFKDLEGSYMPLQKRVLLETASIAGGALLAIILAFLAFFVLYVFKNSNSGDSLRKIKSSVEDTDKTILTDADSCVSDSDSCMAVVVAKDSHGEKKPKFLFNNNTKDLCGAWTALKIRILPTTDLNLIANDPVVYQRLEKTPERRENSPERRENSPERISFRRLLCGRKYRKLVHRPYSIRTISGTNIS